MTRFERTGETFWIVRFLWGALVGFAVLVGGVARGLASAIGRPNDVAAETALTWLLLGLVPLALLLSAFLIAIRDTRRTQPSYGGSGSSRGVLIARTVAGLVVAAAAAATFYGLVLLLRL
jgi:hypothetical protein